MQQHELRQPAGATHKRKRIGRGNASGHGTYATKGMKGQKARSGGGVRPGFEGGQLPFIRRMARKRGFRNPFRVDYEEVNVGQLARFAPGTVVTVAMLREARLVQKNLPVKVLGSGDLAHALSIEADSFSASSKAKIEAVGGTVTWINGEPVKKEDLPETKKAAKKRVEAEAKTAAAAEEKKPKAKKGAKAEAVSEAPAAEQEEADDDAGS